MMDLNDERMNGGAGLAPTMPESSIVAMTDAHCGWRPLDEDVVTFMTEGRACRTCLHLRTPRGGMPSHCLHVLQSRALLLITHACDLHATGEVLAAQRIARYPNQSLYQLSSVVPDGMSIAAFRPSAGVAVIFQKGRRRRLTVFGVFDDSGCSENFVIDAHEISSGPKNNRVMAQGARKL